MTALVERFRVAYEEDDAFWWKVAVGVATAIAVGALSFLFAHTQIEGHPVMQERVLHIERSLDRIEKALERIEENGTAYEMRVYRELSDLRRMVER
jgi:hypothetical protein